MNALPAEVSVSAGLQTVLQSFSRAAVIIQPHDIKLFACFYFNQLLTFRDKKPDLDVFDLIKEFNKENAGVLTCHGTKTHEELLSEMASDYKDYLNEDGILSVLAGADQTEAVVVFRRTDKTKRSETASDHISATDGVVSACRRRSAFFERVPLSEIEFSSNTVLIKTSSIPCKYMIVVHSEKVPECIVFQKEPTESPPEPCEETLESQNPEGLQSEETETIETALADTSSTPELETSNIIDVKSELTELVRKFKTFMGRLVSPQQKSKECSETCLPSSGPEETASSLEQPHISSLDKSSKQAGFPPATIQSKASKPGPACPLSSEPEELTIFNSTCSPVSTSHRPVCLTSTAKDIIFDFQGNMKETMSEEMFGESTVAAQCCLHQHPVAQTRRLSQQTHLSCSSRQSPHHTIRPATCGCHWRLCHILLPESDAMTCSAGFVTAAQSANEHLLIPDGPRVPIYQDVSASSSICRMQPDATCFGQTTASANTSRLRLHTAPALLSSDRHYSQSHDAMRPHLFFRSLPHERHAGQDVDCQVCKL